MRQTATAAPVVQCVQILHLKPSPALPNRISPPTRKEEIYHSPLILSIYHSLQISELGPLSSPPYQPLWRLWRLHFQTLEAVPPSCFCGNIISSKAGVEKRGDSHRALERCDFRIHFNSMNLDLVTQVAVSNIGCECGEFDRLNPEESNLLIIVPISFKAF